MNIYKKYCANVFVSKCPNRHDKGDVITMTTKRGKEHNCIVFNCVGRDEEGNYYYSVLREDGYNMQARAEQRAERYKRWGESANKKSDQKWEESKEGKDFLSLGEPIKVGHHSEKRHRSLIERNHRRMDKAVELSNKADAHQKKAEYWEGRASEINLSIPESLEYYEYMLEEAKIHHEGLKDGSIKKTHAYSMTYAKKAVNELQKKLDLARKLWA